ncbi:MAG TPA: type I-U CRISPR-associated protein Csb2 [Kofleriaceae bacterium]|nr:type I-U CRISPR-associated protein Csb2 [Kofleriaceae bacterium]
MLALRLDLLTGRYAATAYNDREKVEWPPHPARLFSALVATWADAQGTTDGDAELAALQWLEQQAAPLILASPRAHDGARNVMGSSVPVTVFVPVNDVGVIKAPDHTKLEAAERVLAETDEPRARAKAQAQVARLTDKLVADTAKETAVPARFGKHDASSAEHALIERRVRQPRSFPCAVPEHPAFAFEWPDATAPAGVLEALSRLAQRLVRLGHSSSMVHARVATQPELAELAARTTRYVPDDQEGELVIRWVSPGQLERLCRAHAQHLQVEPRVLPAQFVRYREGARRTRAESVHTEFDHELIIYARESGPRLPITSAPGISQQFRRALMSFADQPVPEVISGHQASGAPSEATHLAIVPLPAVIGPYADGALLGLALVLPRAADTAARQAILRAIGRFEEHHRIDQEDAPVVKLLLGDTPELGLRRVVWGEDSRRTLQPNTWTRPSRQWASATPVALDRNPGDLQDPDPRLRAAAFDAAKASIIAAVQRIGLPAPAELDVVRSCVLPGTAKPRAFSRFPSDAGKQQRVLVHVRLVFPGPVRGPVLIGAGRYQGMGLCLPVDRGPSERV